MLEHLAGLGLQVNWEKIKLSRVQLLSFLGELDSIAINARLSEDCAHSLLNCLKMLKYKTVAPLKYFQRLLGHMASSDAVMHKMGMEL